MVICTYNRPLLLEEAVRSVLRHATCENLAYEIVIADNSPNGQAVPLVSALAAEGHHIRRVAAAPPNISIARNAGLRAATAPLVAFLDDDLQVEPGWLDRLVAIMAESGADVAMGPVRARFATGAAPDWDPQARRYTRVLAEKTGFRIFAGQKARPGFAVSTASSIWRRDTCFGDPAPFDPGFGASGGEDIDLFLRLEQQGRRFVWCAEAGVWETNPANRSSRRYQLLRAYSGAQVFAAVMIRHSARGWRRALVIMARGAVQALLGAVRLPPALVLDLAQAGTSYRHATACLFDMSTGTGKLLWWKRIALYHIEKPHAP